MMKVKLVTETAKKVYKIKGERELERVVRLFLDSVSDEEIVELFVDGHPVEFIDTPLGIRFMAKEVAI